MCHVCVVIELGRKFKEVQGSYQAKNEMNLAVALFLQGAKNKGFFALFYGNFNEL